MGRIPEMPVEHMELFTGEHLLSMANILVQVMLTKA